MENPLGSCPAVGRRRRIKKKIESSLSNKESFLLGDIIIIDILSRLPAKDVLRCKCVCRRWRDLSSTRDFTDLHRRSSVPMILKDYNGLTLLDRCWEPARTRSKIHKIEHKIVCQYQSDPYLSHNGLIVAHGGNIYKDSVLHDAGTIIYNPIYRDSVNIMVPLKAPRSEVYGVFFHPVQKEYCTLWRITLSLKPLKVQYRILNLQSNPHWRYIKNPCTQNARIRGIPPVLFDEYLYWMVEPSENYNCTYDSTFNCDIMEYDIRNEEFRVIPCPVPPVTVKRYRYNVNLVDIDGFVSLVQVVPCKELVKVNTWTLKDHRGKSWTSSHYIVSSDVYPGYGVPKAVAFWNEELVLQSDGRLYVCNLKLGTFRKFGRQYDRSVRCLSHVTSLVSLRNCKSKICMDEKDEKNQ